MKTVRPFLSLALSLAALLATSPARADFLAFLCTSQPPPGVTLDPTKDAEGSCAGFTAHGRGGQVHHARARLGSGTLIASDDARTVVFVQTFPLAHLDRSGRVRTLDGHALDGVVIFHDGREVARVGIDALLRSSRGATETVSHVLWVTTFDPVVGPTWKLTTTAGSTIVFDSTSGRMVSRT